MSGKRIGLFGGTFNPVHNGHLAIADAFLNSTQIEKLWVLLTPFPPHKQNQESVSYTQRLQMLKAAFADVNNITVSTVEHSLPKPNYTINTLKYLKAEYPELDFMFCIGEDSLVQFHNWKNHTEILEECDLLVAKRPGFDHSKVDSHILSKSHFVEHIPIDISSTKIREHLENGISVKDQVPEKVLEIIEKEHLYS